METERFVTKKSAAATTQVGPKALLRKKLEAQAVAKLTKIESKDLEGVFSTLDDSVNKQAFQAAMVKNGHTLFEDESVVNSFWDSLDVNQDGTLTKKELVVGLTVLTSGTPEEKLKKSFDIFDFDRSGALTRDELTTVLRALAKVKYQNDEQLEEYVRQTVDALIEKCDTDKNGEISKEELLTAAARDPFVGELLTITL